MATVRQPAVAGLFYPADRRALTDEVDRLLAPSALGHSDGPSAHASAPNAVDAPPPKALVVPHAGYVYSGAIAAQGYATVAPSRDRITRVVLLGPCHRVPVRGLALPGVDALATPLGDVPVDAAAAALDHVTTRPDVHAAEHSLEVQLPFLQRLLGEFTVVPLAVGAAAPEEVAGVLDALWGGPETLIVVSSDLSHYQPYGRAVELDAATIAEVLALAVPIQHTQACGATPLNGLLTAAPRHGLRPRLVAACNSGDTAGSRDRVVGYASVAFAEASE